VRSEARRRANRENGRKRGLVKSRKKTVAARHNARRPRRSAANLFEIVGFLQHRESVRFHVKQ
jgi:hypothetical protein